MGSISRVPWRGHRTCAPYVFIELFSRNKATAKGMIGSGMRAPGFKLSVVVYQSRDLGSHLLNTPKVSVLVWNRGITRPPRSWGGCKIRLETVHLESLALHLTVKYLLISSALISFFKILIRRYVFVDLFF